MSDESINVGNREGVYGYNLGEATIGFQQENFIIIIDALYDVQLPNKYHEEGITKEVALKAAEKTVDNLNNYY